MVVSSLKLLFVQARSSYLLRIQQLLLRDQKDIAVILTTENVTLNSLLFFNHQLILSRNFINSMI